MYIIILLEIFQNTNYCQFLYFERIILYLVVYFILRVYIKLIYFQD